MQERKGVKIKIEHWRELRQRAAKQDSTVQKFVDEALENYIKKGKS